MFELFGSFNNKSADLVRQQLLQDVATEIEFYERRSAVCLAMRSMSLDTWVTNMDNNKMYCDELGLMGLSKMYGRHSVVLTKTKLWSTIDTDAPFNILELLQQCSVRFVYLGPLRFGNLVWKPRNPPRPPLPKKIAPSFEIIEEYTLDEEDTPQARLPTAVSSTDCKKSDQTNQRFQVGTMSNTTTPMDCETSYQINKHSPVGTRSNVSIPTVQSQSSAECVDESDQLISTGSYDLPQESSATTANKLGTVNAACAYTVPSVGTGQYPWKRKAHICLNRVSPVTVDIWTNAVREYHCYTPDVGTTTPSVTTPTSVNNSGYVLRSKVKVEHHSDVLKREIVSPTPDSDIKTEELIKHAESLLERARQLSAADIQKQPNSDSPDVETTITDTPAKPATRKIKCKLCKGKFYMMDELTAHHNTDHGIVKCDRCGKCFDTKESLSKHMNTHKDLKWVCDECGKSFEYESRMLQHQRVHDNEARLYCPKKTCDRSFKNVGDFNRHTKTHEAGGWYTCNKCSYKNKDKRNRDSHMRVHTPDGGKERYECGRCHNR